MDSVTVNMGFPRWSIGVERRLMNQLWRGRGGGGWGEKASLIDKRSVGSQLDCMQLRQAGCGL